MTSYEEQNPPDISINEVKKNLDGIFPSLSKDEIVFHYHGSYNVFFIKEDYVFRFPDKVFRNENGKNMLKNEIETLKILQNSFNLEIPKPHYLSLDPENLFVGYKKIEGISLSRCFKRIPEEFLEEIAKSIGKFLSKLHSNEIKEKIKKKHRFLPTKLDLEYYHSFWNNTFIKTKKIIFPIIKIHQRDWLNTIFSDFLNDSNNFSFEPRITHCDFDTSNILVDPQSLKVKGIIDFENTQLWDPAADLLFFNEGEIFLEQILNSYSFKVEDSFRNRMKFLFCRTCVSYMEFGIENNYPKMIEAGIDILNNNMKIFP